MAVNDAEVALEKAIREAVSITNDFVPTLSAAECLTGVLWSAHTWLVDENGKLIVKQTPRLAILSDEPESGKTTLAKILCEFANRGHIIGARTASAPGVLRAIQEEKATLFLDELDKLVPHHGNGNAPLMEIFNTGYDWKGKTLNAAGFHRTFAPLCMIGLKSSYMGNPMFEPLRSRTIKIHMRMLRKGEMDPDDQYDDAIHSDMIIDFGLALGQAMQAVLETVTSFRPRVEGLELRKLQIWRPLLQVAHAAGPAIYEEAVAAVRELGLGLESTRKKVRSTYDLIREGVRIIATELTGNITTQDIITKLFGMYPDIPWANYTQARKMVIAALKSPPLGLEERQVNDPESHQARNGYRRKDLIAAFALQDAVSGLLGDEEDVA